MKIFGSYFWRRRENKLKDMSESERENRPGKLILLKHGQTHYELDEEADGPLLVCLHGWSTASYVWEPLKPFFRKIGYRVLSFDFYGRGYSDRPEIEHTAEVLSDQLAELLEKLGLNQKEINVVGYSMGGAIAAHFVSQRLKDVKRLLLIAPAGMEVVAQKPRAFARKRPKLGDRVILSLLPLGLSIQFRRAAKGFENNQSVMKVVRNQTRELNYKGYTFALLSSLKGALSANMKTQHELIAASDVSVRAIFAEFDKTIPQPKAMNLLDEWNQNKVSRVVEGAGHAITYTHPKEIMKEVDDFL